MKQADQPTPELVVSTCTTMDELAAFINSLAAGDMLCGRPGRDGVVTLYSCCDAQSACADAGLRGRVAARVAVEVVLQQVMGMPGAGALMSNVREQFEGDQGVRAGWLAPPLTILARLYRKTMNALPDTARLAPARHGLMPAMQSDDEPALTVLSQEQALAVEKLIDSLVLLAKPGKVRGKA